MKTALQNRTAGSSQRLFGVAIAALSASTILTLTPTKASAFDLEGLIGTAMAMQMQMGAYGNFGAPNGHAQGHVASRHERSGGSSGGGNGGGERDARDDGGAERPSKVAARQQSYGPSGSTRQASERDAAAGQMAASDRSTDDEPAYRPSR
jgi:hypothetical protein